MKYSINAKRKYALRICNLKPSEGSEMSSVALRHRSKHFAAVGKATITNIFSGTTADTIQLGH